MRWCVRENDPAEEKEKKMVGNAHKHVVVLNISVKNKTLKGLKDVWERRRDA